MPHTIIHEYTKHDDYVHRVCLLGVKLFFGPRTSSPLHNVQFVKYDVTVSFMAQVLDTVTYLVPQVLDTAS